MSDDWDYSPRCLTHNRYLPCPWCERELPCEEHQVRDCAECNLTFEDTRPIGELTGWAS